MNDTQKDLIKTFAAGVMSGAMAMMIFMIVYAATPKSMPIEWQNDIIKHGYGKWIIDTNNPLKPCVKFEWITNK